MAKKEWLYKWMNLGCNKFMMMQVDQGLKRFVLQSDELAYKCQTQKLGHLFQGRVLVKFSKAAFRAMARFRGEADRIPGGRWI